MCQQLVCGQIARLTAVEDGFGDVRGEVTEADEPREAGRAHPFPLGQCGKQYLLRVTGYDQKRQFKRVTEEILPAFG